MRCSLIISLSLSSILCFSASWYSSLPHFLNFSSGSSLHDLDLSPSHFPSIYLPPMSLYLYPFLPLFTSCTPSTPFSLSQKFSLYLPPTQWHSILPLSPSLYLLHSLNPLLSLSLPLSFPIFLLFTIFPLLLSLSLTPSLECFYSPPSPPQQKKETSLHLPPFFCSVSLCHYPLLFSLSRSQYLPFSFSCSQSASSLLLCAL